MKRSIYWLQKDAQRFLTVSSDYIRLYAIGEQENPALITTFPTDFQQYFDEDKLRCCDLCKVEDDFLAMGYNSGRIVLTKTGVDDNIRTFQNVVELASDTSVPPLSIEFNPLSQFHLLACLERTVSDGGLICVYEANRPRVHALVVNANEQLSCATWFQDDWCIFAAGGTRSLKFYDIRESSKAISSTDVDGVVSALRADCWKRTQIVAVIGDTLHIYDRRRVDHAVYSFRLYNPLNNVPDDIILKCSLRRPLFMTYLWYGTDSLAEVVYPIGEQVTNSGRSDGGTKEYTSPSFTKIFADHSAYEESILTEQDDRTDDRSNLEVLHDFPEMHYEFYRKIDSLSSIADFAYNPEMPSLIVMCSTEEADDCSDICVVKMKSFVTGVFSCYGSLSFASDNELSLYNLGEVCEDDISNVMRLRALVNYGTPMTQTVEGYVESCKAIAEKSVFTSADVKWVWRWLSKMINAESWKSDLCGFFFPGVIRMMRLSYGLDNSPCGTVRHVIQDDFYGRVRIHKGGSRSQILRLCGWPSFDESDVRIREFLSSVDSKQNMCTRAIALAMFYVKVDWAKESMKKLLLKCKGENDVRRFELERFTEGIHRYNGLPDSWLPVSKWVKEVIKDPYLKMVISFLDGLCNGMTTNTSILKFDGISVEDRVGFACLYFNDAVFVESLNSALTESSLGSSLQGLFICGLSRDLNSFQLIRKFVDETGDVQTATLLYVVGHCYEQTSTPNTPVSPAGTLTFNEGKFFSGHSFSEPRDAAYCEALKDEERVGLHIVEDYLDMLNTWGLWKRRARLNVFLHWYSVEVAKSPDRTRGTSVAELCCQFCPYPIGPTSLSSPEATVSDVFLSPRSGSYYLGLTLKVIRVLLAKLAKSISDFGVKRLIFWFRNLSTGSSCGETREQACRQCGKPLPRCIICRRRMGTETIVECSQLKSLSFWFTWCQKCRHGGHMVHMIQWFRAHDECAASDCFCQCRLADADYITYQESCLPDCPSCKNEGLVDVQQKLNL
uniref:Zinc_ribbon_16 domain-containing protein n=1 Tax=Syphacia muris TaxID=451379 RepID=A0A0N5ADM4_9BILA